MASTSGVFLLRPTFASAVAASNRSTGGVFLLTMRFVSGLYTAGGSFSNDSQSRGRKKVIKPRSDVPLIDPMKPGYINEAWNKYFDYVDIEKLGGPLGPSIKDAQINVETIQNVVSAQAATITVLAQQATTNAETMTAIIEVAQNYELPGAEQIPPPVITPIGGETHEGGG